MAKTVVVVGAGHNGLVAAVMLARAGYAVRVVEDKPVVGGACRTERPFAKAPGLATSTGAYLLGLMPPEIMAATGVTIPLKRRDPHYFLPTTEQRYLLFGSDEEAMRRQFVGFFSEADWRAHAAMQAELAQLRDDVAPTWMEEPLSIEDTAERYVRAPLRQVFVDLCRKPVGAYLDRFAWKSDLVRAMYAVTDGFSGLYGSWDTPGTGMNFLIHNMCRLPGSDGTWMIVEGGMGTVTRRFAEAAEQHGAQIRCNAPVERLRIDQRGGRVRGVVLASGEELAADAVVVNADPFRLQRLIGREQLPAEYNQRIDGYVRPGSTLKVNLALRGLPRFTCLPDETDVMRHIRDGFAMVQRGELDPFPTIEWYIHTTVDPTLRDSAGNHNSALFVQWVPREIKGSSWAAEEGRYVQRLLGICDRFAPGTSELVVDTFTLHPQKIEQHFGITHGHIHHVDNGFGFADRLPYATPVAGLYSCSAGCHPAGSVIGAAGHNAARAVMRELGAS